MPFDASKIDVIYCDRTQKLLKPLKTRTFKLLTTMIRLPMVKGQLLYLAKQSLSQQDQRLKQ